MSERKFYKTVFQLEVLSEEPLAPDIEMQDLVYEISDGGCSGDFMLTSTEELDGKACAAALRAQHSDPGFFCLDDDGNDTEDEEEEVDTKAVHSILRVRKPLFNLANECLAGNPPEWLRKKKADPKAWIVGTVGFSNGIEADLILDWRDPVCVVVVKYYDGDSVCAVLEKKAQSITEPFEIETDGIQYKFSVQCYD
jgi:hypothetical protein